MAELVNRLDAEARAAHQGRPAERLYRLDFVVVFDALGYLHFAQAGGHVDASNNALRKAARR